MDKMKEEILRWTGKLDTRCSEEASALRRCAAKDEATTVYGSPSYVTHVRSRSAKFTQVVDEPTGKQVALIMAVEKYLARKRVISIDRSMCLAPSHRIRCRLLVTEPYARLAYMWAETLFRPFYDNGEAPDLMAVYVPEWPERRVIVLYEAGVTFILGTDYLGEAKKGFLRMGMYLAKQRGGLGLHAGSKLLRFRDAEGRLRERGLIMFGLSGTGKTTLTCRPHGLTGEGEGIAIRQDDVVFLQPDCSCIGTEDNFYIKTEGLEPLGQPLLYEAAISPQAILENVLVDKEGEVDFLDYSLTSNGRAVVRRSEMAHTDDQIDLERADIILFLTRRNDVVPPVARLGPAWAAAAFMLGESVETSAGDPAAAGAARGVVGYNPFLIGPEYEEGNLFYEILKANPLVECYLLNTGVVGENIEGSIMIKDSSRIIREIARGGIEWEPDPDWGYERPVRARGLDLERFDFFRYYSHGEYEERVGKLKRERQEWLERFPGLEAAILKAIPQNGS